VFPNSSRSRGLQKTTRVGECLVEEILVHLAGRTTTTEGWSPFASCSPLLVPFQEREKAFPLFSGTRKMEVSGFLSERGGRGDNGERECGR